MWVSPTFSEVALWFMWYFPPCSNELILLCTLTASSVKSRQWGTLVWSPGILAVPKSAASNKKAKKKKHFFQAVVEYFYMLSFRSLLFLPLLFSSPEHKRADRYKYLWLSYCTAAIKYQALKKAQIMLHVSPYSKKHFLLDAFVERATYKKRCLK